MKTNELLPEDLALVIRNIPAKLKEAMQRPEWRGHVFVGGGFIRALIAREEVHDVDVFVHTSAAATVLADELINAVDDTWVSPKKVETDNAITVILPNAKPIQIIHRWVFNKIEDVVHSFDFTVCCAAVCFSEPALKIAGAAVRQDLAPVWESYVHERFYIDLAARRLHYLQPMRNEDAGGSTLRVQKYLARGYRISLDSISKVIARLIRDIDLHQIPDGLKDEERVAFVIKGLLREVDPNTAASAQD